MGTYASAHLAYGYDLGTEEDFAAAETNDYGGPGLPWYGEDDEDDDFVELAERQLLRSVGFDEVWTPDNGYYARKREAEKSIGVTFQHSGHYENSGWVLTAAGSESNVTWSETMELDPTVMITKPEENDWDTKLAQALSALGISPNQDGPKWLVFPSYG